MFTSFDHRNKFYLCAGLVSEISGSINKNSLGCIPWINDISALTECGFAYLELLKSLSLFF